MPRYGKPSEFDRPGRPPRRKLRGFDLDEDEPFRPHLEVADNEPVDTGLLWPDGEPIIRHPNPIGFGRNEDW